MAKYNIIKKNGLYDILDFLYYDLVLFLQEEKRYSGKVKACCDSVKRCVKHIEKDATEDDCLYYGQILSSIKPKLIGEYKRLRHKGLGKADCVICFIIKISEAILDSIESGEQFIYKLQVQEILKSMQSLHSNIRNWNKDDKLYKLWNELDRLMRPKTIISGIPVDNFSLYEIEHPKEGEEKVVLQSNSGRGSVKVTEIDL